MKNQKKIIAVLALSLTLGVVSFSGAHEGAQHHKGEMDGGGKMMHCQMMQAGESVNLTADQQKEVDVIEAKYATEKATLETAMHEKKTAMHKAMGQDSTTMGTMKGMRQGMQTLHQERMALQQKINQEISKKIGVAYTAPMDNCPMQKGEHMQMGMMMDSDSMHHGGQMEGRHGRM